MPKKETMNWINVNNELPKYLVSVLVYQKGKNIAVGWRHCTDIKGEQWSSEECDFDAHGKVTHWIPLPDPPPTISISGGFAN